MANYCKRCGAYIPDNTTKCLACDYDIAEEIKSVRKGTTSASGAAAAAQQAPPKQNTATYDADNGWRAQAEKRRREQQEMEKTWAETEQRRRKMEEELRKKNAAQQTGNRRYTYASDRDVRRSNDYYTYEVKKKAAKAVSSIITDRSKRLGALSYLSILCFLPMLLAPNDEFANYHAKQGLCLLIFSLIGTVIASALSIGWVAQIIKIVLIIKGAKNALAGEKTPLPLIGQYVKY